MRTTLNGLATTIPQLTQIYMYSLQHNLNIAQENRLATESDKRIEKINLDMEQAEEIFDDKQSKLQADINATDARVDASKATTAYYEAALTGAGWDNKMLEKQFDNSVEAKGLLNDMKLTMDRFSKNPNPTEQQTLKYNEKMEHAAKKFRLLSGDVGHLTRKDTLEFLSAETMLTLGGAFSSSDPKVNAEYTTILSDPNTPVTEVVKFLRENNVFQNSSMKLAMEKLEEIKKEDAEALGTFITDAMKDAGFSEYSEIDRTFADKGELVYSKLEDDDIKSVRDTRDRGRDNVIYELARKGVPELGIPPMFTADSAGRIYDSLFWNVWYLWLSPIGTEEWENNHPDVLKQNKANRMQQEIFEDGRYLDEQGGSQPGSSLKTSFPGQPAPGQSAKPSFPDIYQP